MEDNLFSKIKKVVDKYDILTLLAMGSPKDEYDIETRKIAKRLKNCRNISEVHDLVYQTFLDFFGEDSVGKKESYSKIAKELYDFIKDTDINKTDTI